MRYLPTLRRPGRRVRLAAGAATLTLAVAGIGSVTSTARAGTVGAGSVRTSAATEALRTSATIAAFQADLAKHSQVVTSYPKLPPVPGLSKLKGKTVWYIPIGSAVPILAAFGTGMQQSLAKLGMSYHTCDGQFLPTTIAACLNQAATQGAAGVVAGYIDYKLVPTSFDNLVAHHVPVLIAGENNDTTKTPNTSLSWFSTASTINFIQKLDDEEVIVNSGGKAKVLFIGVTDSPETLGGAAYSKQFFAQNCPGCTFTEIDYNTAAIQRVPSQVSAALLSNPGTTYVVDELDASASFAANGIQTAGFASKVKLSGTNGGLDSLQRIKAGQIQFTDVGTSPTFAGWQFTDGIVRMLAGGQPVPNIGISRVFTKANVGGLTLTPAAYDSNDWYGSNGFEQPFLKAWGL